MGRNCGAAGGTNQPGNQSANTPQFGESELSRMRIDDLRERARQFGVAGVSKLRKADLVAALKSAYRKASTTGQPGKGAASDGKRRPGNQRANTPEVAEGELSRMRIDDLRARAREFGVARVSKLRKADLVAALKSGYQKAARGGGRRAGREAAGREAAGSGGIGGRRPGNAGNDPRQTTEKGFEADTTLRIGPDTSDSLKYSQEITSPEEEPERVGRSLATTDHDVIRQWAEARNGRPATVPGTGPEGQLGVLRIDFPEYSEDLEEVSWDAWFATFDARRLNFLYQEERKDGAQSNFFRLENPDREDA